MYNLSLNFADNNFKNLKTIKIKFKLIFVLLLFCKMAQDNKKKKS